MPGPPNFDDSIEDRPLLASWERARSSFGTSEVPPEARRRFECRFEALLGPPRRLQEPSGTALERFWLAFGAPVD